jgi:hypothetical protein
LEEIEGLSSRKALLVGEVSDGFAHFIIGVNRRTEQKLLRLSAPSPASDTGNIGFPAILAAGSAMVGL